jgi:hypothetical protein
MGDLDTGSSRPKKRAKTCQKRVNSRLFVPSFGQLRCPSSNTLVGRVKYGDFVKIGRLEREHGLGPASLLGPMRAAMRGNL